MKRFIAVFLALCLLLADLSLPVFASDTNIPSVDVGYIFNGTVLSSISGNMEISDYKSNNSVIYTKFDLSGISLPAHRYIESITLSVDLSVNSLYSDGKLIAYNISDDLWSSNGLTVENAPMLNEPVGIEENISLNDSGKTVYIDVTPYVSEKILSGENYVSIGITNYSSVSCTVTGSSFDLKINYTDSPRQCFVSKPRFHEGTIAYSDYSPKINDLNNIYLRVPVNYVSHLGKKIIVSVASYNDNNELADVNYFERTIFSSNENSVTAFPVNVTNGKFIKAFVWDANNSPLCDATWYTDKSSANITDLTISSGELYPEFSEDVFDYYILLEDENSEIPEISYTSPLHGTVSDNNSENFNIPREISVTSSDEFVVNKYTFTYAVKKKITLSSSSFEINGNRTDLPLKTEENITLREDGYTQLDFNTSILKNSDTQVTGLKLILYGSGEDVPLQIYRAVNGTAKDEGILHQSVVMESGNTKQYTIGLNASNFTDFESLSLLLKGSGSIFAGKNDVETYNGMRAPVLEVTYVEKTKEALNTTNWSARFAERLGNALGTRLPDEYNFTPSDKYISEQNPPVFQVPFADYAIGYDIIVCQDSELKNIKYSVSSHSVNIYNFPCEFEPGTYYWSARFRTENGYSEWSDARRFTIGDNAVSYVLPDTSFVADKFAKMSHPRLIVNAENITEFRALKERNTYFYNNIIASAEKVVSDPILDEPVYNGTNSSEINTKVNNVTNQIFDASLAYIITDDKRYANAAKNVLLNVAEWDVNGATAYEVQDQAFRTIVNNCAIGYDWLYNIMTYSERKKIEDMLIARAIYEEHPTSGLQDSPYKLLTNPYMSHGWGHMYAILTAGIALADKSETLKGFINKYLPIYLGNNLWSYQDGAFGNGFMYSTYSITYKALKYSLANMGINENNSAYYQNKWKFYFYTAFNKNTMEFGDESYGQGINSSLKYLLMQDAQISDSPYAKWKYETVSIDPISSSVGYYDALGTDVQAIEPTSLDKSYLFKDAGYVALHSDLADDNRISLYFRSSQFGSKNHSHPDQNSFHIQAFGERLAIDSGYYDYYHSNFDMNYTRKTYAHNAITYNGGQGQLIDSLKAKGEITDFLTTKLFDLTGGDATDSYNHYMDSSGYSHYQKNIDKAERKIIYLRPDIFIIIDDLKAKDNDENRFEWWLNAEKNIAFDTNKNRAIITGENAALNADVVYPSDIKKGKVLNSFCGPDEIEYTPSGSFETAQTHKRLWFETEPTNQTKIISVLNPYLKLSEAQGYTCEQSTDYCKLTFNDGTVVYIRTSNEDKTITADEYVFNGDALAVNNNDYLVASGNCLFKSGRKIFSSSTDVSVSLVENEVHLSCNNDAQITIPCDENYPLSNMENNLLTNSYFTTGLGYAYSENDLIIQALKGNYSFKFNTDKWEAYLTDININSEEIPDFESNKTDYYYGITTVNDTLTASDIPNNFSAIAGKGNIGSYDLVEEDNGYCLKINVFSANQLYKRVYKIHFRKLITTSLSLGQNCGIRTSYSWSAYLTGKDGDSFMVTGNPYGNNDFMHYLLYNLDNKYEILSATFSATLDYNPPYNCLYYNYKENDIDDLVSTSGGFKGTNIFQRFKGYNKATYLGQSGIKTTKKNDITVSVDPKLITRSNKGNMIFIVKREYDESALNNITYMYNHKLTLGYVLK